MGKLIVRPLKGAQKDTIVSTKLRNRTEEEGREVTTSH